MGLIPGIVSCLVSACTAVFGLWLLSRCATLVGVRPGDEGRKASFNEVARLAFGKGWVMRLFDVSWVTARLNARFPMPDVNMLART
jgi:amino acid permease